MDKIKTLVHSLKRRPGAYLEEVYVSKQAWPDIVRAVREEAAQENAPLEENAEVEAVMFEDCHIEPSDWVQEGQLIAVVKKILILREKPEDGGGGRT